VLYIAAKCVGILLRVSQQRKSLDKNIFPLRVSQQGLDLKREKSAFSPLSFDGAP
jgi:hypothetical protein